MTGGKTLRVLAKVIGAEWVTGEFSSRSEVFELLSDRLSSFKQFQCLLHVSVHHLSKRTPLVVPLQRLELELRPSTVGQPVGLHGSQLDDA
jgi:hypothetical protein